MKISAQNISVPQVLLTIEMTVEELQQLETAVNFVQQSAPEGVTAESLEVFRSVLLHATRIMVGGTRLIEDKTGDECPS